MKSYNITFYQIVLCLFCTYRQISNIRRIQIPKLKCISSRLAVVFVQYIEARCWVENADVVGAAPTGDAPTTSEWFFLFECFWFDWFVKFTHVALILVTWDYFDSSQLRNTAKDCISWDTFGFVLARSWVGQNQRYLKMYHSKQAPASFVLTDWFILFIRCLRLRKMLGGGMRQAGVLAAACQVALTDARERLQRDHEHARKLAEGEEGRGPYMNK